MIKSGKPGKGKGSYHKSHKVLLSFRNNKMVYLYCFFCVNNHSILSCQKTRKKKRGNGFLFCVNRQAVHIENES